MVRGPWAGDNSGSSVAAAGVKHLFKGVVSFEGIEKRCERDRVFSWLVPLERIQTTCFTASWISRNVIGGSGRVNESVVGKKEGRVT